jgi:hypothetical protein
MTAYEQVADWIVNDSDDTIGEVQYLLEQIYFGEGESKSILREYEDVIEITEKKYGAVTGIYKTKE